MTIRQFNSSKDSPEQVKRALVLAYYFPPIGGSGVQRTIRHVKYLPEFGWQPYVVAATYSTGPERLDQTLLQEINPALPVWRVSPHPSTTLSKWASRIVDYLDSGSGQARRGGILPWARKIVRVPFALLASSLRSYWATTSIWRCLRVIRQREVDLIYTTAPPWPAHLAGLVLRWLTGKPLVVDCRDPWTGYATYRNTGWRRKLEEYLERLIVRKADLVICNHRVMRDDFIKLTAPCDPRKFIVITNGYDADNFHLTLSIPEVASTKEVTLAHVGVVVPGAALPLLEALELVYQEDRSSFGKLKVRFVGGLGEPDQTYLSERIWSQAVEVITRQAHVAAIDQMLRADLLLLMLSDEEAWRKCYPGKLFEYLRAGRPVLAIMPYGIATDLVAEAGVGVSFEPSQVRSIADQLRWFANDMPGFRHRHFRPRPEIIAEYDGRTLTQRLAAAFDQLLSSHLAHSYQERLSR